MRYNPRKDANHSKLVRVFEDMGCSVLDLAAVGRGCPDLLIAVAGKMRLVECKDGDKCPSARKLTEPQARFHAHWHDNISVVTCEMDAVKLVNHLRNSV